MNKNDHELLDQIYQNASMGIKGTKLLLDKAEDVQFSMKLKDYIGAYSKLKNEAMSMLQDNGRHPAEPSRTEEAGLWMGVQLNTLLDKTSSHMAEMLIQGGTMGIIQGEQSKKRYNNAGPHTLRLANQLIRLEQDNIEAMKRYLS